MKWFWLGGLSCELLFNPLKSACRCPDSEEGGHCICRHAVTRWLCGKPAVCAKSHRLQPKSLERSEEQRLKKWFPFSFLRAQELCESWGGHPGLPAPASLYCLCGCKATPNSNLEFRSFWGAVSSHAACVGRPLVQSKLKVLGKAGLAGEDFANTDTSHVRVSTLLTPPRHMLTPIHHCGFIVCSFPSITVASLCAHFTRSQWLHTVLVSLHNSGFILC